MVCVLAECSRCFADTDGRGLPVTGMLGLASQRRFPLSWDWEESEQEFPLVRKGHEGIADGKSWYTGGHRDMVMLTVEDSTDEA